MSSNNKLSFRYKILNDFNFVIIGTVTLIAVMGVASLTPAFPKVGRALHINTHQIGMLITAFTLPGVILTPVLGVLADRFGRKIILAPALFLFGIAGASCALVHDYHMILLFRFIQGIGGASLGALNITLIGDLYEGKERATLMGYNASILSVGTASYPAIGGALATFAWFYPFILPVLAIPVGLLVLFALKNPEPKSTQHIKDYLLNTLKSIKDRNVITIFIISVVTFILLYGSYLTYLPIMLDKSFGASSFVIGIMMTGASLATAVTASQGGKLISRYSEKQMIVASFVLYSFSLMLMPLLHNIWLLLIPIIIWGMGQGLNLPSMQTLLASLAPMEHRAAFMSLNGMVLRLGQTLGPVVIGIAYALWGINGAFYGGAILALAMIPIIIFMITIKGSEEI